GHAPEEAYPLAVGRERRPRIDVVGPLPRSPAESGDLEERRVTVAIGIGAQEIEIVSVGPERQADGYELLRREDLRLAARRELAHPDAPLPAHFEHVGEVAAIGG